MNKPFMDHWNKNTAGIVNIRLNCWGAVAYYFNGTNRPKWFVDSEIIRFLNKNTRQISSPTPNSIMACYDKNKDLIHTAIYIKEDSFWHKQGWNQAEYVSRSQLFEIYDETKYIKYFKPKKAIRQATFVSLPEHLWNYIRHSIFLISGCAWYIPTKDFCNNQKNFKLVRGS